MKKREKKLLKEWLQEMEKKKDFTYSKCDALLLSDLVAIYNVLDNKDCFKAFHIIKNRSLNLWRDEKVVWEYCLTKYIFSVNGIGMSYNVRQNLLIPFFEKKLTLIDWVKKISKSVGLVEFFFYDGEKRVKINNEEEK